MSETMQVTPLLNDDRPIKAIFQDENEWTVGVCGVEKIVAYGEPGEFCMIPWFAIYRDGQIASRVPAHGWGVTYA